MNYIKKLEGHFYDRDTMIVAEDLLGKYLVHVFEDVKHIGKIVEVGVDYAGAWAKKNLRFYIKDNPFVSKP
ncbi:MAG: hypothetical protein A3I12_08125 [Gammaproteobacteria bacterium RIFCSPLOWO2_02_FULL_38_11]|nr:MAG: hypothetical protein A3B69_03485 [Gammaproteobacteria bacterium RIFCSPHIGHO2_02_FULL_38_33]OGT68217.1 MAG: hypothetical protein A3I12_08125 [Gammaproteobacteria bacterium RIFCSPLOWO2_02_FULL_38_11]